MKKYLVGTCVYNEGPKILRMISRYVSWDDYDMVVVDDGSTDHALIAIENKYPVIVLRHSKNQGAGECIRQLFSYAEAHGYETIFFVSGNDKDDPGDIQKLKSAIERGYDFVQGSRYLKGGKHGGMPFYRKMATRFIHPILFSLVTGKRITDSTNGFRAVRLSMLKDPKINLNQSWLDQYELEPYLFYKAITLGYKVCEVPVTKIYPPKEEGYTKMKPFSGWWSILRPLFYLGLKIKK